MARFKGVVHTEWPERTEKSEVDLDGILFSFANSSLLVPAGIALSSFYGRLLTTAYLGEMLTEWQILGGLFFILLGWPMSAKFLHILTKWFGGKLEFMFLLTLYTWTTIPLAIGDLVQMIYMLTQGRLILSSGLAGLVTQEDSVITSNQLFNWYRIEHFLLSQIDLYMLLHLLLLGVIFRVVARLSVWQVIQVIGFYSVWALFINGLS